MLALENSPTRMLDSRSAHILIGAAILLTCSLLFVKVSYDRAHANYIEQQISMLTAIADTQSRSLEALIESYLDKARLVASRTRLRQLVVAARDGPDDRLAAQIGRILGDAADSDDDIARLAVYDIDGRLVAAVGEDLATVVRGGETSADIADGNYSRPFIETDIDGGHFQLLVFAPMLLDGRRIGVVKATLTPRAIDRVIQGAQFASSGEIVLGLHNRQGGTLIVKRQNEAGDNLAQTSTDSNEQIALERALDDRADVMISPATDGDQIPIIAVTRYLSDLDWGLIAKIDRAEVEGALIEIRNEFLIIACLLFVPGIGISLYLATKLERANRQLELEHYNSRLEHADRRFRTVFMHSPIAKLMVRADGVIEYANHEAESLLEYGPGGLDGQPVDALVSEENRSQHAGWRGRFIEDINTYSPHTMAANREVMARSRNGKLIPVSISLVPIVTEQGTMIVTAIIDLTEEKAAHDRIVEHAAALQRSNDELDRFAYVASHDLKAPLQGIAQLASIIKEDVGDSLPTESHNDLTLMQSRVTRLGNLLDSLLQYSRVGRIESQPEQIETSALLGDLLGLQSLDGGVRIEVDRNLPMLFVPRPAIELIFRNLISNAIKHHDGETCKITVSGRITASGIEIDFCDDGPGIPEEYKDRIFELFQTLKRRDEVEGSGMGLALVKKTMESLNGRILVLPREERGAHFRLHFPPFAGGNLRATV